MARFGASEKETPLTAKQSQVATLLAAGHSQKRAAEEVHVSLRTVTRWCQLPEVKSAIWDLEEELVDRQLRMVFKLVTKAITTLNNQLDQRGSIATQAAAKVLDLAIDLGRIARLEREIGELQDLTLLSSENSLLITPLKNQTQQKVDKL